MSVFVIIIGCYTAIGWITDIVFFIMSVAFVAADYFLHLHDWWISSSPLMRVYIFTVGLLSSPPTGILAFMDGLLCCH
ncbi:hypothetical protein [Oryza sativa Japonica Group]|uniref:Uncharacterized protein n=1 Tax=Oryza sativa subsp. japonica TaxID=39947 RepID=Q5JLK1_ORYSJ|nr:hypothetical protein [Oryza sativa Japonica Group]BAD87651.1 hypothetical protein [Oryza sativa Japonica Group]